MASGAHVTAGGVWTDASSREWKEDIEVLSSEEAVSALRGLQAVKFSYRADRGERHVGFVAEDVPDQVATKDRKGLSPMDIVAVLTKVAQELKAENESMKKDISYLAQRLIVLETNGR